MIFSMQLFFLLMRIYTIFNAAEFDFWGRADSWTQKQPFFKP